MPSIGWFLSRNRFFTCFVCWLPTRHTDSCIFMPPLFIYFSWGAFSPGIFPHPNLSLSRFPKRLWLNMMTIGWFAFTLYNEASWHSKILFWCVRCFFPKHVYGRFMFWLAENPRSHVDVFRTLLFDLGVSEWPYWSDGSEWLLEFDVYLSSGYVALVCWQRSLYCVRSLWLGHTVACGWFMRCSISCTTILRSQHSVISLWDFGSTVISVRGYNRSELLLSENIPLAPVFDWGDVALQHP